MALNEVNCTGSAWVEVINRSNAAVPLAGWLLTIDPLDAVPVDESHWMRFGSDVALAPGARLLVSQGEGGMPFGLTCGVDTLRLANASDTLVDEFAPPVPAAAGATSGRIPDGTGDWAANVPTPGSANAIPTDGLSTDPAWLYDPLQVTEIDLKATAAALSQLDAAPDEYVDARVTLRTGASSYGPYRVGLKLKGHATFRSLAGKAAFKVKFGYAVSGQRFRGLKGLTLNNMVQDPSMFAEASSSLLVRAIGVPTARVGYAYVRLNGAEYGLYADVETVDSVMTKRWFTGTRHIYKGDYGVDLVPGHAGAFGVEEGSLTDLSDLEALSAADAGGADGWWDRMQPVADMVEVTRAFAAEHYAGHWDSYSVGANPEQPNNYYLQSDLTGRFSLVVSGTDQTWLERSPFGVYGKGVMMRHCVENVTCAQLYVDALRQISANAAIATIGPQARAILAVIAPWRARDPRREQSIVDGEAQADTKIAMMEGRQAELAAWLANPSFVEAVPAAAAGGSGGGQSSGDLGVTGTVTPASSPVGGSHVWRLQVQNGGAGSALGAVVDVRFSPNESYGFSQVTRGTGCVLSDAGLHCVLDYLGAAGDPTSTAEVVIGTNVSAVGEVSLTATASFAGTDPTPADDTLMLKANSPLPTTALTSLPHPLLGKPVIEPAKPVAGKLVSFSLPVSRSDTGGPLLTGRMACDPSVAGKAIRHTESFKAGRARLSFVVPQSAKGKLLRIKIKISASGLSTDRTFGYTVR